MMQKNKFLLVFVIIFYFIAILGNIIDQYVSFLSWADELSAILLFVLYINKFKKLDRYDRKILKLLFLFFIVGLIPTFLYKIQRDNIVLIKDIVLFSKFFVGITRSKFVIDDRKKNALIKAVKRPTKILIIIIFMCGILNLFIDLQMGGEIRYGLRCYQFYYTHYTFLVASTVFMLSIMLYKNSFYNKYSIMCLLILLFTLRSKAIVFVLIYIMLSIYKKKNVTLNFRSCMAFCVIGFWAVSGKISDYISWGIYNLRTGLHIVGFVIACDYFPLGSGLGTFGSNLSFLAKSPLYSKYGLDHSQAMGDDVEGAFISDTFWPYVYGQFGFIGLIIFLLMLLTIFNSLNDRRDDCDYFYPAVLLLLYLVIGSFAEATFTNQTGIFVAMFINLFLYRKDVKKTNCVCGNV